MYEKWVEAYAPFAPVLRSVYEDTKRQGILITVLPGEPLRDRFLDDRATKAVYQQAGVLCRRLADFATSERFGMTNSDGTPVDYQGNAAGEVLYDPVKYVQHSFLEVYDRVRRLNALLPEEAKIADSALDTMDVFKGERPVLVNGDYTPGNWLVESDGKFTGVIDLEHVSWNLEVSAFTRLQSDYFPKFPSAELVFFEGYGGGLTREKHLQARIFRIMQALYNLMYGTRSDKIRFLKRGRSDFARLALDR